MSSGAELIPAELQALDQWVVWRREYRDDGRPTKVPYRPAAPSIKASTTDPATWADFATAVAVQDVDGIGFVFAESDPYAGVDIDDCINAEGAIDPETAAILRTLDSYAEISPSGTGVHAIIRAKLNGGPKRTSKTSWGGEFENYDTGRYFCVTGSHLPGTPLEIHDRQAELEEVRASVFPAERVLQAPATPNGVNSANDHELLELARSAKNGSKFIAVHDAAEHPYGSDSEADLALANMLAFWCGADPGRIDRLFRGSARMRDKWDERRGESTWGAQTIEKALADCNEFYTPPSKRTAEPPATPTTNMYEVAEDKKGKLILPSPPGRQDVAGQCAWLTAVLALDPQYPIVSGERQGQHGPGCHVELARAGARSIRFEPASRINNPMKLTETLTWGSLAEDSAVPAFSGAHCRMIAYVIRMLCGAVEALSDEQEAAGIIGTFLSSAVETDLRVTTYGTAAQRYETAVALRRELDGYGRAIGPPRYARDFNTGEFLIAIKDLAKAARDHYVGSSLERGWLDGRMEGIDWKRVSLNAHAQPGRDGRKTPHTRMEVYRGHLPTDTDEPVST